MFRGFIVSAIRTVVSAFSQAYRNAAYAGAKGAPESGAAAVNRMMKKPLTIEEARQILEVPEDISATQLKEVSHRIRLSTYLLTFSYLLSSFDSSFVLYPAISSRC